MATLTNTQNTQARAPHIARRVLRGIGRALAVLVALILALGVLGAVYETAAEAADARAYPPPGQMIDLGGYRLHLNCAGAGSPTVLIDAGWGDWSASWASWVQPEVAKTTRICTYDRAGMGWSEAGPLPRTARQFANELHSALHSAGELGPYVLVGHSMGGLTARVFAHDYAADVAGVVLIESMNPRQARPSVAPAAGTHASGSAILTLPARVGLLRVLAGPLGLTTGLSPEFQPAYTAFSVTPRSFQATLDEGAGMTESLRQAEAIKTLGTMPLIVLSRGIGADPEWQAMQAELLQLSAHSQQIFAEKSRHSIQLEQPEAAVDAIEAMLAQLRQP